jgi:hypothetical protein
LQRLRRSTEGVHEELRRTDLQVRISDVHEIVREEVLSSCKQKMTLGAFTAATVGLLVVESVAAENARKLAGGQIRATLAGMQLTDEVHYRFVYDRDGTLRSYAMGVKKSGKWVIEKDQLCLYRRDGRRLL